MKSLTSTSLTTPPCVCAIDLARRALQRVAGALPLSPMVDECVSLLSLSSFSTHTLYQPTPHAPTTSTPPLSTRPHGSVSTTSAARPPRTRGAAHSAAARTTPMLPTRGGTPRGGSDVTKPSRVELDVMRVPGGGGGAARRTRVSAAPTPTSPPRAVTDTCTHACGGHGDSGWVAMWNVGGSRPVAASQLLSKPAPTSRHGTASATRRRLPGGRAAAAAAAAPRTTPATWAAAVALGQSCGKKGAPAAVAAHRASAPPPAAARPGATSSRHRTGAQDQGNRRAQCGRMAAPRRPRAGGRARMAVNGARGGQDASVPAVGSPSAARRQAWRSAEMDAVEGGGRWGARPNRGETEAREAEAPASTPSTTTAYSLSRSGARWRASPMVSEKAVPSMGGGEPPPHAALNLTASRPATPHAARAAPTMRSAPAPVTSSRATGAT